MNNHKQTKRALLTSVMALVMCVVMLVGTTFAWFTDTARTSVNTIKAGNLKVLLMDKAGNDLEGKTLDFVKAEAGKEQTILWEPGATYQLPEMQIKNDGNLALKYKIDVSGAKVADGAPAGSLKLLDVLEWTYEVGGKAYTLNSDKNLGVGESDTLVIKAHMKEEANNDYQNMAIDGIAITVYATQDTVEYDSTRNDYDKNAQYPEVSYAMVSTQDELNDALTNPTDANGNPTKDVAVEMPANSTFTLDNGIANDQQSAIVQNRRNVTFIGDGSQTVDVVTKAVNAAEGNEMNYQRGSSFAFQNVTVQGGTTSYGGIVCNELTFEDCTIKGKLTLYGKATFINCTFENDMADQYSIWTWGGTDVTFEGCTFNTNGKAILLYGGATASNPTNLVVNNCTFNDRKNGAAGKAAIEIGNDYNATYTLTIKDATVNGFADGKNTGSKLWANKNSMDAAHLTVIIDGAKVQ